MEYTRVNTGLNDKKFENAIVLLNQQGYSSLELHSDTIDRLGKSLYLSIDKIQLHPQRENYYNEIAFYWPQDWSDVDQGIGAFHEQKSLTHIFSVDDAKRVLSEKIGEAHTNSIIDFAFQVKQFIIKNHHGLKNNELRLSRVMVRQMNTNHHTKHGGSDLHEDMGYSGRPYQQLLSAIVTTYGIPTKAERHQPKVGELLIFNAYDRRRLLGRSDDFAFIHRGPKSGPKMFFFFEFLGPST